MQVATAPSHFICYAAPWAVKCACVFPSRILRCAAGCVLGEDGGVAEAATKSDGLRRKECGEDDDGRGDVMAEKRERLLLLLLPIHSLIQ